MVNDSLVLDNLDVWAESGHDGACKKVVYAVAKQGLLKIHFPEVKAGQALISGIAIASANQELKPSVFPASGLKASELLSAADRNWVAPDWSWEAADKELLEKTPKELLPEDKNARASVAYEAETGFCKRYFYRRWSIANRWASSLEKERRTASSGVFLPDWPKSTLSGLSI